MPTKLAEKPTTFFFVLESLRGVAALAIVLFHFFYNFGGHLAVDFFFVLSGFVLSHNYLYKNRMNFIPFVKQRIIRLYPLHIFRLFLFIAAFYLYFRSLPTYIDGTKHTFIQQLLLLQNIGLSPSQLTWNYPSWSISTEFIIGFIFILLIRKWTPSIIMLAASIIGFYLIYKYDGDLNAHRENIYYINAGLLRCLSGFILGVIAYRAYMFIQSKSFFFSESKMTFNILEAGLLLLIVLIIYSRGSKYHSFDFIFPFLFLITILVFAFETKLLLKIKYLGEISYSLYLNHVPLFLFYAWILEKMGVFEPGSMQNFYLSGYPNDKYKLLVLIVYIVSLIVLSHFTYIYVEKRIRDKFKK